MRTKVDLSLDIVHELPLAMGPQEIADGVASAVTQWELMGVRDFKLSTRATLIGPVLDAAESILVVQALRAHADEHRKLAAGLSADIPNADGHRASLRELAEVLLLASDKLEVARNAR